MRSRDRITLVAGMATLVLGVLAIGGASRWVVVAMCVLAAAGAASQISSRRKLDRTSPLLLVIGVATVLTALQLVPVPDSVHARLEPTAHELITDGDALLDSPVMATPAPDTPPAPRTAPARLRPLSMDPASTRIELAKLVAYFLIAWMTLRAAASERGRQRLLSGVAGVAGLVAMIGIVHELLGADKLYGVYQPEHLHPIVMAPLMNANHLACLMSLGAIIAAGLAFHERRAPAVRALWIVIVALCIGVGLATKSRGGVMGLAAGTTVAAVVMVLQRLRDAAETQRRDVLRVAIPAAVVVLCTLVLVVYLGGGEVRHELESTHLAELENPRSKYAAWGSALELIEDAPVLGIGRGAFETAFTRVHPASSQFTFSHVENEYLQAVVDWGVGGAILLVLAGGTAVLLAIRRWRHGALGAAALGGLTAVAVHSVVDFGLELPGVAIPTIIVAATLLHVPLKEAPRSRRRTALRTATIAAGLLAAAITALPISTSLDEDHAMLDDDSLTLADARAAFERHPLDYLAAAYLARESADAQVQLAYLNLALRLHPTHPGLHRTIGRWLANGPHKRQAALEYRFAIAGAADPTPLVSEVLALFPVITDAVAALPVDNGHWAPLVNDLVAAKRSDVALAFLERIVDTPGVQPDLDVWKRMATLATAAGDLDAAERAASAVAELEPSVAAAISLATVELQRKEYDAAAKTLAPAITEPVTSPEHIEARLLSCDIEIARPDWTAARACLTQTLVAPGVTMVQRRKIHGRLAKVADAAGDKDRAQFERGLAEGQSESSSKLDGSGQLR
jgi:O-antigen ligase